MIIVFVGYADPACSLDARRFEDEVLALLPDHGADVIFRGHRTDDQDASLPLEVHVLRFPSEDGLTAYLRDPRRQQVVDRYGEVFREKVVVSVDPVHRQPHEATTPH
jgi:hypothetical protein